MTLQWPLGVLDVVFKPVLPVPDAARRASVLGFDHLDVTSAWDGDPASLAVPIGVRMVSTGATGDMARQAVGGTAAPDWPAPKAGWYYALPPAGPTAFDDAVAALRACPGATAKAWPGSACGDDEALTALLAAVPGLRLCLDVGHVVYWGGDPFQFLRHAEQVHLREAAPGRMNLCAGAGALDHRELLRALDRLRYSGRFSIAYFDHPQFGWGTEDPEGLAVEFAAFLRSL